MRKRLGTGIAMVACLAMVAAACSSNSTTRQWRADGVARGGRHLPDRHADAQQHVELRPDG